MALPTYQSLASEEELDDQALGSGALPGGSASVSPLSQASIHGSSQTAGALPASGALNNITSSVGALQKSGFDAFGNPRSDTWTENRYNPNDPASSSYIADPNAGQYVFDPVTGKHTLVSGAGATSVTSAAGNDSVSAGAILGADLTDLSNEKEAVTGVKPGVDFRAPTTFAENYLMGVDPTFQQKFFKPGSSDRYTGTFVNTYRVVNGEMVPIEATPTDIAKGDVIFYVGGAPGADYAGENRVGQAYIIKNGQLTPVGEASQYKSPEKTPFFKEFLLEGVLPMVLAAAGPAGLFEGLGGALSGGALTGASASSLGSGAFNLVTQLAAGRDPVDALKSTALSYGAGQLANQLGSMLPQDLGSVGRQAITQLVTTGKINPLSLATTAGIEYASDVLAQETGLSKASAGQLIRSGMQFAQGNTTGALTSLASSGITSGQNSLTPTGGLADYGDINTQGQDIGVNGGAKDLSGSGGLGPLDYIVDTERDPNLVKTSDVSFGGYKIPGLSLGDTERVSGQAFLTDDPEGGAPYLNQSIQMLDRAGNPVLDASGQPIFYTAIYDPTDQSLRYSLNATDESGTFIGKNIISQKPQIIADDEGNQFVINPLNGRILATLSTASDQSVSDLKLPDFLDIDSYLDDITFAAFEDLRNRLQSNDQTVSLQDVLDLEAQIFQDAVNAGASDEDAMSAAQSVINPFKSKLDENESTLKDDLTENLSGTSGVSGITTDDGFSGFSGQSGDSGFSGFSGVLDVSGFSGISGDSGESGFSGLSGTSGILGFSGFSGESGESGFSGFSGESGASGFSGLSGVSGASGFSGVSGESGASGFSGVSGESGASGFSGFSGESGISGFSGFSGESGISGWSGVSGESGASGFSGMSGESGASGFSGFSGESGISGYSGASGISGESGFSGFSGISGESGFSGYSGVSGLSGFSGASGISGISGFSGFSGVSGESGYSGASGVSGVSGFSGFSGVSGTSGFSGYSGESGVSGFSGVSGTSGASGFSGFSGISGINGVSGFSGFSGRDGRDGKSVVSAAKSLPAFLLDSELQMLKSSGDTSMKNPLEALIKRVEEMNQIDPSLAAVMSQRLGIQPQQAPTFTYGQESSIDDILGLREPKKPEMEEALYAEGGYVEPLRAKPMNLQFMNEGGALGRENFKDGKHVAGEGDGQSDDIPAWLADGEFVFPADVVSALGNGSTKAGTDKLYKMMHEIRARARSTKVKDLPPPAHKSPLDYLKKGK